jgi:hypothetical protein
MGREPAGASVRMTSARESAAVAAVESGSVGEDGIPAAGGDGGPRVGGDNEGGGGGSGASCRDALPCLRPLTQA